MGIEVGRVADVAVERPDGTWELASGYLLDGEFVLTARHVLTVGQRGMELQARAFVRLAKPGEAYRPASLDWAGEGDEDFALLKLNTPLPERPMVRWGDLVRPTEVGSSWRSAIVGFPFSASQPDPRNLQVPIRETQQFTADIHPGGGVVHDKLQVVTSSGRSDKALTQLSGAPVFVEDHLVGIVHSQMRDSEEIWALPVRRLFAAVGNRPPLAGLVLEPLLPERSSHSSTTSDRSQLDVSSSVSGSSGASRANVSGSPSGFTALAGSLQGILSDALLEQLEGLTAFAQSEVHRITDQVRALSRAGHDTQAMQTLEEFCGNQPVWQALPNEHRARLLCLRARLRFNQDHDVAGAEALLHSAAELARVDDEVRVRAFLALWSGGVDLALGTLGEPSDIDGMQLRVALLMEAGKLDTAQALLQRVVAAAPEHHETFRLQALVYLARKRLFEARLAILRALEHAPGWQAAQYVEAVIDYHFILAPAILPDRVPSWPEPPAWTMVLSDDASRERLLSARRAFEARAEHASDVDVRLDAQVWQLACLANDERMQSEAVAHCLHVLEAAPTDPRVIHWAVARGYTACIQRGAEALQQSVDAGSAQVSDVAALINCYLGLGNVRLALRTLHRAKRLFNEHGSASAWCFWWVQCLARRHPGRRVIAGLRRCAQSERVPHVRFVALEALGRATGEWQQHAENLEQKYRESGDPVFLFEWCGVLGQAQEWAPILEHADAVLDSCPTAPAVQLIATAAYNVRRFRRCLALLDGHLDVFPGRVLPTELVRMRIGCMRRLGLISDTVQAARELVDRDTSTANLLILADAYAQVGNFDLLGVVAEQLLDRSDLSALAALQLADRLARPRRTLAEDLWHKAYIALPDVAVVPAFAVAERLGIQPPSVLVARLWEAGGQDRDDVRRLTLGEGVAEMRRLQAEMTRFEDLYRQGNAAIHGLGTPTAARLDYLYHVRLSAFSRAPDPLRQPPLLIRDGSRPLAAGLLQGKGDPKRRLNVDITALVLAAHFDILDVVEQGFAPLRIPAHSILLLTELQKAAAPLQPRRKALYQQIVDLVAAGLIATIDDVPHVEGDDPQLCEELGVPWVSRYVHARKSGWYLVEFVPAYRIDRMDVLADMPVEVRRHVVNCRAIAEALRSAPYTAAEYEEVLKGLGSEGATAPSKMLPPQRSTLFCHGLILDTLAEAGMLDTVCRRFTVVTDLSTVERIRGILAADARAEEAVAWFDRLIARVSRGIGRTYVFLPDLGDATDEESAGGGRILSDWSLMPLLTFAAEPEDVIWVDDRAVSDIGWRSGKPLIGIVDVLRALVAMKIVDEQTYYAHLIEIRAANLRFIPVTSSEILYHLRQAVTSDGQFVETGNLEKLRRYVAACLVQWQMMRHPAVAEGAPSPLGENMFILDLEQSVKDALAVILQTSSSATFIAQAEWLLVNMYLDYLSLSAMKVLPQDASGEHAIAGIGLAGMLLRALLSLVADAKTSSQSDSSSVPEESGAERFRTWVERRLLAPALDGDPLVGAAVADAMKEILVGLRREGAKSGLTIEQREQLWQVVEALPKRIHRLLVEDGAFTKAFGVLVRPCRQVADLQFAEHLFWQAASDAYNGHPSTAPTLQTGDLARFERSIDEGEIVRVRLLHPVSNEWLSVEGEDFALLPDTVSARVLALTGKADWFECTGEPVSAGIARLAALEPVEARVAEGRRLREQSASSFYAQLEWRIGAREHLESEDFLPPSIGAVLRALRLPDEPGQGSAFESAVAAAASSLLAEVGLSEAMVRLTGLPAPLPEVVFEAVRGLDANQRRELRRHLFRNARSPVGVCHLVRLARLWGEDDPSYLTYAARLARACLSEEWLDEADAFTMFVQWVSERLAWSMDAASVPAPVLLAVAWSHAHRVLASARAANAAPANLARRMWSGLTMLLHDFADWKPEYRSDIAFPRRLSGGSVVLAGLAYALHVPVSVFVPQTETAEPGSVGALLQACVLRLVANVRASNSLCSFLGRGCTSGWLGTDSDGYAAEVEEQLDAALEAAIEDIRSENAHGWNRLGLLLSDQPVPESAAAPLKATLGESIMGDLYKTQPRVANDALLFAARQFVAEPELHHKLVDAVKASAQVLVVTSPSLDLKGEDVIAFRQALDHAPNVLLTVAVQASRMMPTPRDRLDQLLALLATLVDEWPGLATSIRPFVEHLREVLPVAEGARCWPLLIRCRAEA